MLFPVPFALAFSGFHSPSPTPPAFLSLKTYFFCFPCFLYDFPLETSSMRVEDWFVFFTSGSLDPRQCLARLGAKKKARVEGEKLTPCDGCAP